MDSKGTLLLPVAQCRGNLGHGPIHHIDGEEKTRTTPVVRRARCGWWLGNLENAQKVYIAGGIRYRGDHLRGDRQTGGHHVLGGNLMAMGKMVREMLPKAAINFVADNDNPKPMTGENTGIVKRRRPRGYWGN
jgi:hypothetical protein